MSIVSPYGYDITDPTAAWVAATAALETAVDTVVRTEAEQKDYPAVGKINTMAFALESIRQIFNGAKSLKGPFMVDPVDDVVAGDADAGADDGIFGNNSAATASGITILTTAAGVAKIAAGDAVDPDAGRLEYAHSTDTWTFWTAGVSRLTLLSTSVHPTTDSAVSLGLTGQRFLNLFTDAMTCGGAAVIGGTLDVTGDATVVADLTVSGLAVDFDNASPVFTVGNELGQPTMRFLKTDAGGTFLQFRTPSGTGSAWWEFQHAGGDAFTFNRLSNTGVAQDIPLRLETNGNVTIANNLAVKGYLTVAPGTVVAAVGEIALASSVTDSANKLGTIVQAQFVNANGLWSVIEGRAETAANKVNIGGGVTGRDAATTVNIYTAAVVDTTVGTVRVTVDSAGDVIFANDIVMGTGGPILTKGSGTPESVVTADVGSIFMRTDGGAGTSMYVKESGTGNTGWVGK